MALLVTMVVVGTDHPDVAALISVPLIVVIGKVIGIYDRRDSVVRKSTLDETPALFQLATLFAMTAWLINGMVITHTSDRRELLVDWIALALLIPVFRFVARAIVRRMTPAERCLVVGDSPTCDRIETKLAGKTALHARVVARLPVDGLDSEHLSMMVLSDVRDVAAIADEYSVDRIIIAPERADADGVLNVIRAATSLGVKVSVVPRLLEVVGSSAAFDEVEGVPLLSLRTARLSRSSALLKRAVDLAVAVFACLVLSPLLIAIAIAIKLDSRGPIIFRQIRIGRDGKPFEMLKFRTMGAGADQQRDAVRHLNQSDGLFKIADDPRVTRVGRLLRRASLDELPQLWNVLRGDMSLVGPRPLIAEEDRRIEGWHRRRLQLMPGMTGHWQILGSARIPLNEMVKIDYLYVTNWSLWNDLKILVRTVAYVAARRGM
jgi:exopolysaccharide biosynthesis polyprenyl glycosylphosphotransferase